MGFGIAFNLENSTWIENINDQKIPNPSPIRTRSFGLGWPVPPEFTFLVVITRSSITMVFSWGNCSRNNNSNYTFYVQDVYAKSIFSVISGVVQGLNATIFAYGSTGRYWRSLLIILCVKLIIVEFRRRKLYKRNNLSEPMISVYLDIILLRYCITFMWYLIFGEVCKSYVGNFAFWVITFPWLLY